MHYEFSLSLTHSTSKLKKLKFCEIDNCIFSKSHWTWEKILPKRQILTFLDSLKVISRKIWWTKKVGSHPLPPIGIRAWISNYLHVFRQSSSWHLSTGRLVDHPGWLFNVPISTKKSSTFFRSTPTKVFAASDYVVIA